ncbi:MAG TPA: bacteriohemerythrin [Rectinemataceae bacterium]|nr:bacteriohemerythrin [Rectinemataceae bacterium]
MAKFVEWDQKYNVGIPLIDAQHKHLIQLTNGLFDACTKDKETMDVEFREVMKESVDYVLVHFRDEEELMRNSRYEQFGEHKKKHEEFIKTILEAVQEYKEGKKFVPNNFARFLRDWLFDHIAINDKEFSRHYFSKAR